MNLPGQEKTASLRAYRALICCAAIFLTGLAVRLILLWLAPAPAKYGGEPVEIALSLVRTGRYADAYGLGAGLTAHCAPLHPLLLSALFLIFGTGAHGAAAANVAATLASSLAFALLPAISVAAGLGLFAGALAGMAGALLPVNYWVQTSGAFETALTALALVGLLYLLCRAASAPLTGRRGAAFGFAAGLAALLNPVLLAAVAAGCCAVLVIRHRSRLSLTPRFFAAAAGCVILTLAPWAMRNYRALGSPILTRSNFGLELQVSNNDLATANLERNVRSPAFGLMHPYNGDAERARVRAMGEAAYQRAKKREAFTWIASHKARFLSLTAERFRLFWFPEMSRRWQSIFEGLLTVAGFCGLVLLFRGGCAFAWIGAAVLAGYSAVYYVIQASPRYRFPLEPLLLLLAASMVSRYLASHPVRLRRQTRAISLAEPPAMEENR